MEKKQARRVEEVIYIVPEERNAYLESHLNPSPELQRIMWMHGMRNQFYYKMNDLILMSFEYVGNQFQKDMVLMQQNPEMQKMLIPTRRRDVPADQLTTTNWWAPLQRYGGTLLEDPMPEDDEEELALRESYQSMTSGYTGKGDVTVDFAYDEDDWSESIHI